MAVKWISTGEKGIRYYEHATRKHGIARDRYFSIRYSVAGKITEEGLGWWSEGWTLERAIAERSKLKEAHRTGQGPTSLAEKREQASQAKVEAERQKKLAEARNVTLSEYWPVYLTSAKLLKQGKKKDSTWTAEEGLFEHWLKPVLGDVLISEIEVDHWDRLMGVLVDAGLSPRTRQYAVMVLRQVLAFAYSRKLVPFPPPTARDVGATIGKGGNRRTRVLTGQELQAIIQTLAERDPNAYAITFFCAMTGCRFGEAAGLEWKDIDLATGEATFRNTKNGTDRTIPLPDSLADFLSDLRGQGRLAGHVFINGAGKPYTQPPQPFRDTVADLGLNEGRAKRDKVVFHTLRHTAATRLAKAGTSLPDLQSLGGWKSPLMALRYAHSDDKTKRKAMSTLEGMMQAEPAKVVNLRGGKVENNT